ncbi:hypothetical protein HK100_010972 [Physocladia obscura]|uniref:PHD and RING finger domain-containing protein 1 n=1 Tax=Physocladia obscura TaxID=109957 RepID=A0AAD5XKS3_9FUNG|nr:hypothetical protein HK100_010972 [Physocladia obscura]
MSLACAICLMELRGEEDGELARVVAACAHLFHFTCIERWAAVASDCPVDRLQFTAVEIVKPEYVTPTSERNESERNEELLGLVYRRSAYKSIRTITVKRKQQTATNYFDNANLDSSDGEEDDADLCAVCNNNTAESSQPDNDVLILCDLCDAGFHLDCVGLRSVPSGSWFCRACRTTVAPSSGSLSTGASPANMTRRNRSQTLVSIRQEIARDRIAQLRNLNASIPIRNIQSQDSDSYYAIAQYLNQYRYAPTTQRGAILLPSSSTVHSVGSVASLNQSNIVKQQRLLKINSGSGSKAGRSGQNSAKINSGRNQLNLWTQFETMKRKTKESSNGTEKIYKKSKIKVLAAPQKPDVLDNANPTPHQSLLNQTSLEFFQHSSRSSPFPRIQQLLVPSNNRNNSVILSELPPTHNLKNRIAKIAKNCLDSVYKNGKISKERYKEIAREITQTVYTQAQPSQFQKINVNDNEADSSSIKDDVLEEMVQCVYTKLLENPAK